MPADELSLMADRLEAAAAEPASCIDQVQVIRETASTQDAARAAWRAGSSLLVVAGRQTAGRGRLGRAWADTSDKGLAATFALDAAALRPHDHGARAHPEREDGRFAIAAGLAAIRTAERLLEHAGLQSPLALRWPNDVVMRAERHRKLAGVLIERSGDLVLIGIGMNIAQRETDWPEDLRARAISIADLGLPITPTMRADAAVTLLRQLSRALIEPAEERAWAWRSRDCLTGATATFEHAGARTTGTVERIEPGGAIRLRTEDGRVVSLPALTTSLVVQ